jgi:hypothetical protein
MKESWIIRGRKITIKDVELIRKTITEHFDKGRKHISKEVCHAWQWYQASGHCKDRACRDILLFLHERKLIRLPAPLKKNYNYKRNIKKVELPEMVRTGTVKDHPSLRLKLLTQTKEFGFYNGIVQRYHYQGCKIIVGKSLRYLAHIGEWPVACLGWGSAAWSMDSRDRWIGWSKAVKDKNLEKIVNNIRFLILPWVKVKYLASHLLSLSAKRVEEDWHRQYGRRVYLLETFVEEAKFKGTCYKAANWKYLGQTKGSAKRGSAHEYHGNIKGVYVYPLSRNFREKLIEDSDEAKK